MHHILYPPSPVPSHGKALPYDNTRAVALVVSQSFALIQEFLLHHTI